MFWNYFLASVINFTLFIVFLGFLCEPTYFVDINSAEHLEK